MNNLCDVLSTYSRYVWTWLKDKESVQEETLTEFLLYHIEKEAHNVYYRCFSKREESKNGADWEWWIIFPGDKCFMARVQAKKLRDDDKRNYGSIHHSSKDWMQIENLITDSKVGNFLPLYAFYSPLDSHPTLCPRKLEEGVHLWNAHHVNKLLKKKSNIRSITRSDALKKTVPLWCLFCCGIYSGKVSYDGMKELVNRYLSYSVEIDTTTHMSDEVPWFKIFDNGLPGYIEQLIKIERNLADYDYESEFKYDLDRNKLNGLLIMDFRNTESEI